MAGGRTLVVNLVANTNSFSRGMRSAFMSAQGFRGKMGAVATQLKGVLGPALIAAAAAAGALAIKLGVDGVKAAIADQKSMSVLAQTLRNLGLAHESTGVESFIAQMESATGVADEELRPAFGRLVLATQDVNSAMSLMQAAMDVSVATGKDFKTVYEAMSRAIATGTAGRLAAYGITVNEATVSTQGMTAALIEASSAMGGAAANEAKTLEGRMRILGVEFDNVKEAFGRGFLQGFGDETAEGVEGLTEALRNLQPVAEAVGQSVGSLVKGIGDLVNAVGEAAGSGGGDNPLVGFAKFWNNSFGISTGRVLSWMSDLVGGSDAVVDSVDDMKDSAAAARGPMQRLGDAVGDAGEEAEDAADAFAELNGFLSETRAILNYEQALDDFRLTLKETGVTFDTNTEKGRKNYENLLQFAEATAGAAAAQETLSGKAAAAMTGLSDLSTVMNRTKMSPETRALLLEPFQALINDLAIAGVDVTALQAQIDALKGKQVVIEIVTKYRDAGGQGIPPPLGGTAARGGLIKGPGGPTADMVPMRLSSGEFVMQASAVKRFGVQFMSMLNSGRLPGSLDFSDVPGPSRNGGPSSGSGLTINGGITVNQVGGEPAERSLPRTLRRMAWVAGLDG